MRNIVHWSSDAKYLILEVNLQYNKKYSHLETVVDEKSHVFGAISDSPNDMLWRRKSTRSLLIKL